HDVDLHLPSFPCPTIHVRIRLRPSLALFSSMKPAPTETYTLSLHDALPIFEQIADSALVPTRSCRRSQRGYQCDYSQRGWEDEQDRKSTRLNSSHVAISYAVFCLKKKSDSLSAGLVCESKTLPTTRSSSCTS